ncbi:MAG: hypothetical protein JRI40_04505 [Deltaproteobacteria bacterium]|nr:hypothetical protein [Deltaproteobacteria bacterium]
MRKRIYRTVDVKALNLDEFRKVVKNQKIVLGVDVAKEDFVAALMNEKREVLFTIKWKHPIETGVLLDVMLHKLPDWGVTGCDAPQAATVFFRCGHGAELDLWRCLEGLIFWQWHQGLPCKSETVS